MKIIPKNLIENAMIISVAFLCFYYIPLNYFAIIYSLMASIIFTQKAHKNIITNILGPKPNDTIDGVGIAILLLLPLFYYPSLVISLVLTETISNFIGVFFETDLDIKLTFIFSLCLSFLYLPTIPLVARNIQHIAKTSAILCFTHNSLCQHGNLLNLYGILEDNPNSKHR